MPIHQVYVIWTNPLFHDSLRQVLKHKDINWVGASSDFKTAIREIANFHPDTILIEEVEGKTSTSSIMNIVDQYEWDLRVIGVSLDDNQLSIFHHAQKTVGKPEDLIELLIQ